MHYLSQQSDVACYQRDAQESLAFDNDVLGATLKHALACERLNFSYKVKLDRQSKIAKAK